jgi:hypothetical protein
VSGNGGPDREAIYAADPDTAAMLEREQRLRDLGYAVLPEVLGIGGDFDFPDTTVADIVHEANRYLLHQQSVDLAGARILATLGEAAVKAQAFDAIAALVRRQNGGKRRG